MCQTLPCLSILFDACYRTLFVDLKDRKKENSQKIDFVVVAVNSTLRLFLSVDKIMYKILDCLMHRSHKYIIVYKNALLMKNE